MINYDKAEIRSALNITDIYEILAEWGAEPEYTDYGILCSTICHNEPGEGSRKLYYYSNSDLFTCYTGCGGSFDIFELTQKVMRIQKHLKFDLNEAVRYIAYRFGIIGSQIFDVETCNEEDWKALDNYNRIQNIELKNLNVKLEEYNDNILDRFNYNVVIAPWEKEGINLSAMEHAKIGFYPGGDQITIPHFDKDGHLVGVRGRTLVKEDAERYGKYRPLRINNQWYSHPLGFNLYNLNNSKDNIKIMGKAIIFESEKSCLQYQSHFGIENDITVACCGSNISVYQIQMLLDAGAKEIIVAFDRQFQDLGDKEYQNLVTKLKKLHNKYKNYVLMSFIFDKEKITSYKASPIDEGPEKFLKLFNERVVL